MLFKNALSLVVVASLYLSTSAAQANDVPIDNAAIQTIDTSAAQSSSTMDAGKTVVVTTQSVPVWATYDARIEAVKAATVSAQTSGRIIKLYYDVNDLVPEGAPLLEITSKEQGAELAGAEADFAKAKALDIEAQAQLERYQELFPQGAISKGSMDEAIANARSTEQAVSAAKARIVKATESLKYTIVSAPFSGIVTARHVEVGETVSPGQALLSGYNSDEIRAVTQIPQRDVAAIRQHTVAEVTLSDGTRINSLSVNLFNFADPQSHSYRARILLDNSDKRLSPGTLAKVRFQLGSREALLIPVSALVTVNELQAVYRKQGDQFILTQVRVGQRQDSPELGDKVAVLAGLEQQDEIAIDGFAVFTQLTAASKQ